MLGHKKSPISCQHFVFPTTFCHPEIAIHLIEFLEPDIGGNLGAVAVVVGPPPPLVLAPEQRGPLLLPAAEEERDGGAASRFGLKYCTYTMFNKAGFTQPRTLFTLYRVTGQDGKNLQLTEFQQFPQLVGCYCSYLLPRQHGGTSQI